MKLDETSGAPHETEKLACYGSLIRNAVRSILEKQLKSIDSDVDYLEDVEVFVKPLKANTGKHLSVIPDKNPTFPFQEVLF